MQQRTVSRAETPNTSRIHSWQFPSSTFMELRRFLFTFFNVSDQILHKKDQIEMKLHSEYDYECIRNSLSIYSLLSQKAGVSNRSDMASSQSKQRTWFWYHQLISVDSHLVSLKEYEIIMLIYKIHFFIYSDLFLFLFLLLYFFNCLQSSD